LQFEAIYFKSNVKCRHSIKIFQCFRYTYLEVQPQVGLLMDSVSHAQTIDQVKQFRNAKILKTIYVRKILLGSNGTFYHFWLLDRFYFLLIFIYLITAHTTGESVILAITLLTIQSLRRLYECLFVNVDSGSKMNLLHYIVGYVHYYCAAAGIFCEAPGLFGAIQILCVTFWLLFWPNHLLHIIWLSAF